MMKISTGNVGIKVCLLAWISHLIFPLFIRDFLDVMISENKCTTDSTSSFYGKTGESAIISDFMELFLAGMETTSSSLMWAFLYLLHYPGIT